ncbi:MAG: hypothetical protein B6U72_05110 [Candidatus Altiarchaeales archaeon ex4484_2]|nr:MAG: hypothetical protein B6U72_05110 [Candidatus Altiarchaeales archaeon ex4484_2]
MNDKYFEELKKTLGETIPAFDSPDFKRMRDQIKTKLKRKETDFLFLIRSFKILVVGDWNTTKNKKRLLDIRNNILRNSVYAETIDNYYDIEKRGGLSQIQIFETCCIRHQLIVFIDGEGPGTITEQNYICENYMFQGKVIFFIEESKFDRLKDNPAEYIKNFPTIITYRGAELLDKTLVYSRLRLYRLATIIKKQESTGRGLKNPEYTPWSKRLEKAPKK